MQSTKRTDDDRQSAVLPMPIDSTGPDVAGIMDAAEEESQTQPPPTRHTEASTDSTPRNLNNDKAEALSEEFGVIEKAARISAAGDAACGAGDAGDAERQKLLSFDQEARASSKENSNSSETFPQNMEEGLDPLDLAKIVEARLRDSGASPAEQECTTNLNPTTAVPQAASAMTGTHRSHKESISSLDLAKIVEDRLQDSGQCENITTQEGGNSPSTAAVGTIIEQQNRHLEQKVSNNSSTTTTGEANRIGLSDTNVVPVDTVQSDGSHEILHLPRLERSSANRRRPQSQPGAYPSGGNFQGIEEIWKHQ
ncbi:hypothetical protein SEMRO_589_G171620.1 [Seminavis robusta]|uniref:Uncharacterized protein n=1 Tax=Seminavis robusta TaxID=568900 RepID=A0A9N8E7U2_9STRA|nr:hypothetical protein SEMRO_589_G171620.1 [Seminavis robusta]|eukprot:Sro589_g171620.1 n/a (310) ;mRNA; f:1147-2076